MMKGGDGKIENSKIGREEFVCPLIYPFAEQVAYAQKIALNQRYCLKIYDGYRPNDVCNKFWRNTNNVVGDNSIAYNLVFKNNWNTGWFVASSESDHARGIAIDVTLVYKNDKKTEIDTQSDMHDLSANSTVVTWNPGKQQVEPNSTSHAGAKLLYNIMVTEAGMTNLSSEWWHFNLNKHNNKYGNYLYDYYTGHTGSTSVTYTNKESFKVEESYSPANSEKANKRTVTITANKDIASVTSVKNQTWTIDANNKKKATCVYKENMTDAVTIKDTAGNSVKKTITIQNTFSNFSITSGPVYTLSEPANEYVDVTITTNQVLDKVVENTSGAVSVDEKTVTITYDKNTTETVKIWDVYGNYIDVDIKVDNIDKTPPKILETKYYYASNLNQKWVLITADEPIEVENQGKAKWMVDAPKKQVEYFNSDYDYDYNYNYRVVLEYDKNYDTDTITVRDAAGNIATETIKIDGIDDKGPNLTVSYNTDGKSYYNSNYSTNKDVTVTVTADEPLTLLEGKGWTLSNDKMKLTKTYVAESNSTGTMEEIEVRDKWGNITKETIFAKIDTIAPRYTRYSKEVDSDSGSITVKVLMNEKCSIVLGDNWEKSSAGVYTLMTKKYTDVTSEEGETVRVNDNAGNEYEFGVIVSKDDNGNFEAKVFDKVAPILEDIIYGKTEKTPYSVNVTLVVNEQINEVDGWTVEEGKDDYANKWLLKKIYEQNTVGENYPGDFDYIEIKDKDGNKIVGNNEYKDFVTADGKVKIQVLNIDKDAPKIDANVAPKIDSNAGNGNVKVTLTFDEELRSPSNTNWKIVDLSSSKKISGTIAKGATEILKVQDTVGNANWFKITVNEAGDNVEVINGSAVESIDYWPNQSKSKVTVQIVTDRKIGKINNQDITDGAVDGWTVFELPGTYVGKGILKKVYEADTVEDVKIEDIDGNKVIGDDIIDGKVHITVEGINEGNTTEKISKIEIKQSPDKTIYYRNDILDLSGLVLDVTYEGESEPVEIKYGNDNKNGIEVALYGTNRLYGTNNSNAIALTQVGPQQRIIVYYGGETTWFYVTVNEIEINKIEVSKLPNKTKYKTEEKLDTKGLVLNVIYNNGFTKEITDGFTVEEIEFESEGTKNIKVEYEGKTTTFSVVVNDYESERSISNIKIADWPNGDTDNIVTGFTIEPEVLANAGMQEVTVTYKDKATSFNIVVIDATIENIKIKKEPNKTTFVIGEILNKDEDLMGLVVEAEYSDGSTQDVSLDELEIEDVIFDNVGTQAIKVTYKGKETSFNVNVRKMNFQILGVVDNTLKKVEYNKGDKLDVTGLRLYVRNEYGEIETIDASSYDEITYSPMELMRPGTQTVIVKHGDDGDYITFDVTVKEKQNTGDNKEQEQNANDNKEQGQNNNSKDENNNGNSNNIQKGNDNSNNKTNEEQSNSNKVTDEPTNGNSNNNKDNTTAPSGYKDANTATSRLPQTGVGQVIIVILVICAVISGALFIKYRKI